MSHSQEFDERPWIVLATTYDIEAWIDQFNRDLQRLFPTTNHYSMPNSRGYGICFRLTHGGEIYMHTTPDGEVLLDVTEDASWITPVIAAATNIAEPASSIWQLPSDAMTQLIYGLNTLIAATRIVLEHDYKFKKRYY
jgi:hypothetical protein